MYSLSVTCTSIHPFSCTYPIQACVGAGAYHSCHWVRRQGAPWTGCQSVPSITHFQVI